MNIRTRPIPLILSLTLSLAATGACSLKQNSNENNLRPGDIITLNRDITTPRGEYHLKFQRGEIKKKVKAFDNNCITESRFKGPVTFSAGPYIIRKVQYNEDFFSDGGATVIYSTIFQLEATHDTDSDKNKRLTLQCQVLDSTQMHHPFPAETIKQVMGEFVSFEVLIDKQTGDQLDEQNTSPATGEDSGQSSSRPETASP